MSVHFATQKVESADSVYSLNVINYCLLNLHMLFNSGENVQDDFYALQNEKKSHSIK